jgi:uncharacterized protein
MSQNNHYPRLARRRLLEALSDTPAVLIHGPRQCGKTTLARLVGEAEGYSYHSFDDDVVLAAAKADPFGFVSDLSERAILDEVQKAPEIFPSMKLMVDRNRVPGRFLLAGSTNVLLLPELADSLAGRLGVLRLHPLAQAELERVDATFLDQLFEGGFKIHPTERLAKELADRICSGGYPAALTRPKASRRTAWYRDYVDTLVQRDVRSLARIASLDALPRLLTLAAGQTARLMNVSDLASPFQLSRPTIREYVTLLERIFLLHELPAWHNNRLRRSIKTPKLHMGDTGIAAALLGYNGASLWNDRTTYGQLLETFVFQELRRQADSMHDEIRFYHFRDKEKAEVDIVLERGPGRVAGVEVKAAASVAPADFRGMRRLRDAAAGRFVAGVVLYDGETSVSFGEGLYAVPVRRLWEDV